MTTKQACERLGAYVRGERDDLELGDLHRVHDELERLRGQEAAGSFVAQTWRALDPDVKDATDPTLAEWLDALARAHEDAGTRAALQAATETLDSLPPASVSPGVELMRASIENHRDDLAEQLAHAHETGGQDR